MVISEQTSIQLKADMEKQREDLRLIYAVNLKRLRENRGLSQTALAALAGSTPGAINVVEKGKRGLGPDLMLRLANVMDVHPDGFVRPIDNFDPSPPPSGKIIVLHSRNSVLGVEYIDRPMDVIDDRAYACRISDDSMSPRYMTGELVIASPSAGAKSGDFVIAKMGNSDPIIRRLHLGSGMVILSSFSATDAIQIFMPHEVTCCHKIVWHREL